MSNLIVNFSRFRMKMANLVKFSKQFFSFTSIKLMRHISLNANLRLKEIQAIQKNERLEVSGVPIPSPRAPYLVPEIKECGQTVCPECTLGLNVKHTDVLILSQYVRSDGCMLPRRITGLCNRQQKKIGKMVTMAQKAGLMPNLTPANSKKDPKLRFQWKKYNKYFDESSIKC